VTIDGFLTFLALLVAVFTVMSRAQRLNFVLKIRLVHILVIVLAFIVIIVLEFYDSLFKLGWVSCSAAWPLKPNEFAFLCLLVSGPLVAVCVHKASLPQNKLHLFRDLVEELMKTDQYVEALTLMETHLDRLVQIYHADFLMPKIRKRLESFNPNHGTSIEKVLRKLNLTDVEISNVPKPSRAQRIRRVANNAVGRIAVGIGRLFPSNEVERQWVIEIFQATLLQPEYVRAVARFRPYFSLQILLLDIQERYDFSEEYFRQLILDRSSILYLEIKKNQNLSGRHRYRLPKVNRLLRHIFYDVHVAEELGVWRPIGEQMIAELDRLHHGDDGDHYNGPLEDYRERGRWKCPLFIGIRFFDIMVSEAIDQNIQWHMWLYYFTDITNRICRNYYIDPQKVNPNYEFPTPYSFLLYEMVSTLCNWINKVRELPAEQENALLKTVSLQHQNGNPIKSSILVLGECLRTILITENIPARQKRYFGSIVLDLYFEFIRQDALSRYAEVLRAVLVAGGLYERSSERPDYLGEIIKVLVEIDKAHRHDEDVSQLMHIFVHRFIEKFGQVRLSDYVGVEPWQEDSIRLSSGNHAYVVEILGNE